MIYGIVGKEKGDSQRIANIWTSLDWFHNKLDKEQRDSMMKYNEKADELFVANNMFHNTENAGWLMKSINEPAQKIAEIILGMDWAKIKQDGLLNDKLPDKWIVWLLSSYDSQIHTFMYAREEEARLAMAEDGEHYGLYEPQVSKYEFTYNDFLEQITTSFKQDIHPNTWVNMLFAQYDGDIDVDSIMENKKWDEKVTHYPNMLITDVSDLNELDAIRKRGGKIISNENKDNNIRYVNSGIPDPYESGLFIHFKHDTERNRLTNYYIEGENMIQAIKGIMIEEEIIKV